MQPNSSTSNALTVVMEVMGALAGLLLIVIGLLQTLHPAAGYNAGSPTTLMVMGGTLLVAAAHSNKWLSAVIAKAGQADSILTQAEQYLPILTKLAPQSVGPLIAAGVTDLDAILKALAAAQAAPGGQSPATTAAQLAGQGASPAKNL